MYVCIQISDMAGDSLAPFPVQILSGLVSDVETAHAVLGHVSANIFRQVSASGVQSLFDSPIVEKQLDVLMQCLSVLSSQKRGEMLKQPESGDGVNSSTIGVSGICLHLLDSVCCPLLNHLRTSSSSCDDNHGIVRNMLSVLVPSFFFVGFEIQVNVVHLLTILLSCKEASSFHLQLVRVLSQLYESSDSLPFDKSTANELLTVVEELSLDADEPFVGQIIVQLVPSILRSQEQSEVVIARLWSVVQSCYVRARDGYVSRCCFLMCCFADVVLTPGYASTSFSGSLLGSSVLWNCVQKGLRHAEALTRKRAIFLLRRTLDFAGMFEDHTESSDVGDVVNSARCLCERSSVWNELIILFEILEEKQVSLYLWWNSSVVRMSVCGRWIFPALCPICV